MLPRFLARRPTAALVLALAGACSSDPGAVVSPGLRPGIPSRAVVPLSATSGIVISQVYGGGGNANATYKNDFIELYNPGPNDVDVSGASVQYASANGTSWQVTNLVGTIPAGKFYLVKEAAGAGGTTDLPTPDATGAGTGIAMAAGAGKVALVANQTALAGSVAGTPPLGGTPCPTAAATATIVDFVGYGTGTSGATCYEGSAPAPTLTNTTAGLRKSSGSQDTNDNSADFQSGAPNPHNSGQGAVVGPLDHVQVSGTASIAAGAAVTLTASLQDAGNLPINDPSATYVWTSGDPATVQIVSTSANTASIKGLQVGGPVTVTVQATSGGVTKSGTFAVTVTQAGTITWIDASASVDSLLPVGFQAQMFLTARVASGGTVVPATFQVVSLDPTIATAMDVNGATIITAISPSASRPRFQITATPIGGGTPYTFTTSSGNGGVVKVVAAVAAPTSIYAKNDEFGDPTPATPGSTTDMLIVRPEYTLSYNQTRGTPNWVSYELDARQFGSQDRCNCFTADPNLPAAAQIFTSDYTNGGYDRGHMTRSADRTAAIYDNATTFYLTNVVPQTADLNQGVWAQFENALGDSAQAGRAVYIITGPLYTAGKPLTFLKNEGKVAIPDSTWKVAFIGPKGTSPFGLADVAAWNSLDNTTVLAVNMPNVAGVRNDPWAKYLTSIDKIEASTGYDLLSLLPDNIENVVESVSTSVRALDMDVQPGQVSVSSTAVVNVVLYSTSGFDATAVSAANTRLVVNGGAQVAPIARGAIVNTSVADVNGDGLADRIIGFSTSALRAAGFGPGAASLVLQLAGATPAWQAFDVNPPAVVP